MPIDSPAMLDSDAHAHAHAHPDAAFQARLSIAAPRSVAIGAQNVFVLRQQGLRREHVGAVVLMCAASRRPQ